MNIEDLELTVRSHNRLQSAGIDTVEKLIQMSWKQLNEIDGLGDKSISEIAWRCIDLMNGTLKNAIVEYEELPYVKAAANTYFQIEKIVKKEIQRKKKELREDFDA